MQTYRVNGMFYSLQGEGFWVGRPAVFLRFAGCNLKCWFCDTDHDDEKEQFGGIYKNVQDIVKNLNALWYSDLSPKYLVITGGEPLLQIDQRLIDALRKEKYFIEVETNGTVKPKVKGIHWVSVSPKKDAPLKVHKAEELKLVHPQGFDPREFEEYQFKNLFLQPLNSPFNIKNLLECQQWCRDHPNWRLSLRIHKVLGIL